MSRETGDTTLDLLPPGSKCVVVSVNAPQALARRLMEMGVIRGTKVEIVRLAPLGDPVELLLRGYHLSLRKEEARHVRVVPES